MSAPVVVAGRYWVFDLSGAKEVVGEDRISFVSRRAGEAVDWQSSPDGCANKLGSGLFRVRHDIVKRCYVVFGGGGSMVSPPEWTPPTCASGQCVYWGILEFNATRDLAVSLFLLEYSKGVRVGAQRMPLRSGVNLLLFSQRPEVDSFRLALRMAIQGHPAESSLSIESFELRRIAARGVLAGSSHEGSMLVGGWL
jgi:hypothetical protein